MIGKNKIVLCIIFILVGLFVCFLGRLLFKPILFITGILIGMAATWLICYATFLYDNNEQWVFWVILTVSILIGLVIGFFLFKFPKVGAFFIAAWGGFSLALLLYNSFMYKIDIQIFFWCWICGLALISGILVCFLY